MSRNRANRLAAKPPRLRGGAYVALVIGGTGLLFSLAGWLQYVFYDRVTILPGSVPLPGGETLEALFILTLTSSLFCIFAVVQLYRARRISVELRGEE